MYVKFSAAYFFFMKGVLQDVFDKITRVPNCRYTLCAFSIAGVCLVSSVGSTSSVECSHQWELCPQFTVFCQFRRY